MHCPLPRRCTPPGDQTHRLELEVLVIESMVRAGIDDELDWRLSSLPQLAILLVHSAAGVQSSRARKEDERGYPAGAP